MKIRISAVTDVGKERDNNEDAYIFCPDLSQQNWQMEDTKRFVPLGQYGALLVVADGMGGANAGEVASDIAVHSISNSFSSEAVANVVDSEQSIVGLLQEAVSLADADINKHVWDVPDTAGMGTTVVVCWLLSNRMFVAWCGDSRCYLYNPDAGLKELTKDHSYVQELIDQGNITEEEAFTHPESNIITRGLGDIDVSTVPDVVVNSVASGDMLLLCSDGLCGYCTNQAIGQTLGAYYPDAVACRDALLKQALDAGGNDNICIAVAMLAADDAKDESNFLSRLKQFFLGK